MAWMSERKKVSWVFLFLFFFSGPLCLDCCLSRRHVSLLRWCASSFSGDAVHARWFLE